MNRRLLFLAATASLVMALPVHAVEYAGLEIFYSTDADSTDIEKSALDLDFSHSDSEHYQGLSLELARFRPLGQSLVEDHRLFYRFAGGDAWKWNGRIGSDGHDLLGSAAIHNESTHRQEYFIEREVIETPLGLQDRLYSTFLAGAFDLPLNDRNLLTTVIGAQDFSEDNLRLHFRGNYIYTISTEHGLSAQLRTRYFHDSEPNESDYFAPGWYAQAIPTLQLRRYVNGWRYSAAAGYGKQRAADTSWRPARLLELSVVSPRAGHDWIFEAGFIYSNTPASNGFGYDYRQFNLSVGRAFR
jgi:hypothetical protein